MSEMQKGKEWVASFFTMLYANVIIFEEKEIGGII